MAKLLIIKHPNTDMAEIVTTDRLCEYRYAFNPPADEELSPEFIALRDKLTALHGFKKIEIGRHDIHMERYEVFEWDELTPLVTAILSEFTGSEYEITVDDRAAKYAEERARRGDRLDDDFYGDD